ncbi:DUF4834 family protein [Coprobacter sp.]
MIIVYILIFFIIFILLSAVGIIGTIARILFGSTHRSSNTAKNSDNHQNGRNSTKWYTYQKRREKVFDKTDGEYVEFEEIKEEEKR